MTCGGICLTRKCHGPCHSAACFVSVKACGNTLTHASSLTLLFSCSFRVCGNLRTRSHFAALNFCALHSSDGNSPATFTLDGKTGPHDTYRCWEHGARILA